MDWFSFWIGWGTGIIAGAIVVWLLLDMIATLLKGIKW